LGVQDSGPVVGFEVGLGVHIHLYFNVLSRLLDGVCGDTDGSESTADQSSNSGWAPFSDNFSRLEGEFGSKDRVLDGTVVVDLTERKGLVDWRAFVTKCVDRALRVDGDADGQTTSDTRSGRSRGRKIFNGDARNVLKLGLELGHVQGCARDL
jgi:hypothetical protein